MKKVPIKALKSNLAFWTDEAFKGHTVQITKHNKPFVVISRSAGVGLYQGHLLGKQSFKPLSVKVDTLKTLLRSLEEDRND